MTSLNNPIYIFKKGARYIRDKAYYIGDTYGIIGPETIYNDQYYKKRRDDPWRSDARNISKVLYQEFEPGSVIDFGCAIGGHLEWFHEQGIDVHGIEGNDKAFEHAVIPESHLEGHDLREPYKTKEVWNLALCIEVAEDIPERYSEQLVQSLVTAADIIIFTAAKPGQHGTHHINLQSNKYWEQEFNKHGYMRNEDAEKNIKNKLTLEETVWFRQNLFVFVAEDYYHG